MNFITLFTILFATSVIAHDSHNLSLSNSFTGHFTFPTFSPTTTDELIISTETSTNVPTSTTAILQTTYTTTLQTTFPEMTNIPQEDDLYPQYNTDIYTALSTSLPTVKSRPRNNHSYSRHKDIPSVYMMSVIVILNIIFAF